MSYIKKLLLREEKVGIKCDICNKQCTENYAELKAMWGPGSEFDGEEHSCHMCELCYLRIWTVIEERGGKINVNKYLPYVFVKDDNG